MWRMQVNRLAMISATPSPDSRIAKLRLANRGRLWLTRLSFSSTPPGLPPRREHWLTKKGEQIGHAMRSPSGPCRPSQCELTCCAVGRALPRFFPTTNGMERLRRELEGRLGSGGKQTHCRQGGARWRSAPVELNAGRSAYSAGAWRHGGLESVDV